MNAKMMDILAECVSRQYYQPKDGLTFCNIFVDEVVKRLTGFTGFDKKMANEIVDLMRYDPTNWTLLSNQDAIRAAISGQLVVAGWKNEAGEHGHVCVLWPADTPATGSDKWSLSEVPWVCSVGMICVPKIGANWVFGDPPSYWRWNGSLFS